MRWALLETKVSCFLSPTQQPYSNFLPPPPSNGFDLNNKVSPNILLLIIILAIIFFLSGMLHLLVKFLMKPPNGDPNEMDNVTALEGQLQQLFHLHDSGVDQSFIDTLPLFNYKDIIGLRDPFDCAVCLCEFEPEDKLRLVPKCSHAFHVDCIDTWLLSHSTCPLCRTCLLSEFPQSTHFSTPLVFVLESRSESSTEVVSDREVSRITSQLNAHCDDDFGQKSCEIQVKEDEDKKEVLGSGERVVSIKLGKFKDVDGRSVSDNNVETNADARRCFSMGSFSYVMDENSSLLVPIRTPLKKQSTKKGSLTPGHRPTMSECGGCDSNREFNAFETTRILEIQSGGYGGCADARSIGRSNKESFSISKIWLRGKGGKSDETKMDSSRRSFSFRFPVQRNTAEESGAGDRRTTVEIGTSRWENGGSEIEFDDTKLQQFGISSKCTIS